MPSVKEVATAGAAKLEQDVAAFAEDVRADPSQAKVRALSELAASARAQARRDKAHAAAYIAFAGEVERLSLRVAHTLEAHADFVDKLNHPPR